LTGQAAEFGVLPRAKTIALAGESGTVESLRHDWVAVPKSIVCADSTRSLDQPDESGDRIEEILTRMIFAESPSRSLAT
jgi:hypothetical protein